METISGAPALMKALEKEGVKEVFGLPGGANLPMYDELYKSNIRHILVRHELSAAHMADGFGRVSRKAGVCFATSGPGATNIITGLATAQADSAPMIAVTGQVPVKMIGRDAFQESDIIGISNPIVKYAFQPREASEIPEVVKKGFYIAETGRPGAVLIDIPKDVQQNEAEMIFHDEANKLMVEADCVLAIGTRFSDRSVGTFEEFEKNLKIIHMDVDPAEIGKNQTTHVAVVGDVKASLRIMVKLLIKRALKKSDDNVWIKHVNEVRDYWRQNLKIHPGEMGAAKILRKLREVLPKEAIVTTEVGQHQMWASLFFDVIHPGTFFSSTGLGTMGWGFPAAIGAKTARPDVPVVDIAGDGSFNMTENSLATSVLENLPVIVFLVNNYSLGMVAQWQRTFYDRRMIGVDQKNCPDYVKLAESYGAQGIRAQSLDELGKAIKAGLKSDW